MLPSKLGDNESIAAINRRYTFFPWTVQESVEAPMEVVGGEGIWYWDAEGRRFMDFSSQMISLTVGYQNPEVIRAICDQARKLCSAHTAAATEPRGVLGRMLAEVAPDNLNKVFFALGGAEAIENAMKLARLYTGRNKIISRYRSYHGATYGAISLTGGPQRHPVEPGISGVVHVFDPYCYRCVFGYSRQTCHRECISHIEEVIKFEGPDEVAALFLEGVTGSSGLIVPPDDYWPRLREITQKYGILLVDDEVMSGFGRTGEWFAVDHWNVTPDLIATSKGLTSSYMPLGAVLVSDQIAEYFEDKLLPMGMTWYAHTLSCAAGAAVINVYKEDGLIENSKALGTLLGEELEQFKEKHNSVGDVRYLGLFGVLELVKDRESRAPMDDGTMKALRQQLLADGLTTQISGHLVFICPPLCITSAELRSGLSIVDKALIIADARSSKG